MPSGLGKWAVSAGCLVRAGASPFFLASCLPRCGVVPSILFPMFGKRISSPLIYDSELGFNIALFLAAAALSFCFLLRRDVRFFVSGGGGGYGGASPPRTATTRTHARRPHADRFRRPHLSHRSTFLRFSFR